MSAPIEATLAEPKFRRCEGFTRIECLPCDSEEDIQKTTYDCLGVTTKKYFCTTCRSYILTGPARGWESD